MRAENNSVVRETLRRSKAVTILKLNQGKVVIVASSVNEENTAKTANDVDKKTSYVQESKSLAIPPPEKLKNMAQWCVRIALSDQALLGELVRKLGLELTPSEDTGDDQSFCIVATVQQMAQLAKLYDDDVESRNSKQSNKAFHPVLPTLSFGIENEFMDNRYAEYKATIAPRFVKNSPHTDVSRKLTALKICPA